MPLVHRWSHCQAIETSSSGLYLRHDATLIIIPSKLKVLSSSSNNYVMELHSPKKCILVSTRVWVTKIVLYACCHTNHTNQFRWNLDVSISFRSTSSNDLLITNAPWFGVMSLGNRVASLLHIIFAKILYIVVHKLIGLKSSNGTGAIEFGIITKHVGMR